MNYDIKDDPVVWIESEIEKRYSKIKDIVYEDERPLLQNLSVQIVDSHKRKDLDKIKKLFIVFFAIFEIAEQDYRDNVGVMYQLETIHLIQRILSNKDICFDSNLKITKYPEGTIICIRLPSGTCIDLCFGMFETIKRSITSQYYILFHRTDFTDYHIFYTIDCFMKCADGQFTNKVAMALIDGGIMYVNKG